MKGRYEPVLPSPLVPSQAAGEPHRNQRVKLKDLVPTLQSVRAYLLKEDFQQLWITNHRLGSQVPRQWCAK